MGRKQNVGELLERLGRAAPKDERVSERRRSERRDVRIVRAQRETPPPAPATRPIAAVPPPDGVLAGRVADLLAGGSASGWRTVDLGAALDVDASEIRDELLALERLGVVFRTGRTRATRWFLG